MKDERSCWSEVTDIMAVDAVCVDRRTAGWFDDAPQRVLNHTSYYKFAAKMFGRRKRVLDVGCGDGLGTWILAAECGSAVGVDADEAVVSLARANWPDDRIEFACARTGELPTGTFDGVLCIDALDQVPMAELDRFLGRVTRALAHDGVAVVGLAQAEYEPLPAGQRLEEAMQRAFHHVFLFGALDEVVQTGYSPRSSHVLAVGCRKR